MEGTVKTRAEILAIWPEAIWFPDDPCPVGVAVVDDQGQIGELVGPYIDEGPRLHNCPDCTHRGEPITGMWLVRMEGWKADGVGYTFAGESVPAEQRLVVVKYPPSLRPAVRLELGKDAAVRAAL